ncbi:MAG: YibE/F family protein [Candidatus Gracilibacteria bacterium]|nr:YibE/F family protein [Candidatus Gracilibacteria bacterium]
MFKNVDKIIGILILIPLTILVFLFSPKVIHGSKDENKEFLKAEIVSISNMSENIQNLELKLMEGEKKGSKVVVEEDNSNRLSKRNFEKDDKVIVSHDLKQGVYYISDYDRTKVLFVLFLIFIGSILVVTGWRGIGAVLGLGFSFFVLFKIILPFILGGINPVWAVIAGSALIVPGSYFASHGLNKKTLIAIVGAMVILGIIGSVAFLLIDFGNLTGLATENVSYLSVGAIEKIDFRGLVLAGVILSMLGVLDDVAISQVSIVQQLKQAKEKIKFGELYRRSMSVGEDHIASMVNTLVLVYAGASLPLLLLFVDYAEPFLKTITIEVIAEEVIRTMVGSIGLVLVVPVTTLLAVFYYSKKKA